MVPTNDYQRALRHAAAVERRRKIALGFSTVSFLVLIWGVARLISRPPIADRVTSIPIEVSRATINAEPPPERASTAYFMASKAA
jgi:hypothetical protein